MDLQDNNIIFILDVIKFDVPGAVTVSNIDDFVIYIFSVLVEFEPDLITVNIDLLGLERVAFTEVKGFAGFDGVLVIAVKNKLGEFVSAVGFQWDVFLGKEANNWILVPVKAWLIIFVVNIFNGGRVDEATLLNYISFKIRNTEVFCFNIVIKVVVEACKVACVPVSCSRGNTTSYFISSGLSDFLCKIEPEHIAWSVSDLERQTFSEFICGIPGQSKGVFIGNVKGVTVNGNIIEFAEFIVRFDLYGICIVNEPDTFNLGNAVDCTLEDLVDMDLQDSDIVFILDVIKFDVPGAVTFSNIDDFVIYIFSVLVEFEPDLITVNIDLLGLERVALSEVKGFAGSDSVLVIAVKNKLGEFVSAVGFQWDILVCEETEQAVVVPANAWLFIFVVNLLNLSRIYNSTLSNYIAFVSADIFNGKSFSCNVIVNIVVECCELSSIDCNAIADNVDDIRAVKHWTADLN